MKIICLTVMLLIASVASFVDAENALKGGEKMRESFIAKVLPAEYAAYEKALTEGRGLNDGRASITLLSKAKESLARSLSTKSQEQDNINAYRAAWRLCLRTMQKSNDQATQQLVVDKWNEYLKKDDDAVPSQIYALSEQWDRKLLTVDFWQILRQTKKSKTVSSICYVLYLHGNREDVDRLVIRRKDETKSELRGLMQNAINWMNYRLSGDTTNPGPAVAPPRME